MDRYVTDIKNGCYQNPVLPMDFSDPDAIRVGEDYYLISSSFTYLPGVPVLHSKDLVHWERIGNCVERLPFDRYAQPAHGCGTWAPALRYHAGRFYAFIPLPDEGIFYTEATDPAGPWSALHCVKSASGWIDPCPLWDDDGSVYMAHAFAKSRCGIKHKIQLSRLDPETLEVVEDGPIVFDGTLSQPTAEGPKMYKRNGWYYVFAPAGGVKTGWQTVLRSKNPFGPYEYKVVMRQGDSPVNGPHQGAWVDTVTGQDWFLHFQDVYAGGRIIHLQPMHWENDWPIIGINKPGNDYGEPVMEYTKPDIGKSNSYPVCEPDMSDDFTSDKLGMQWQWNANPQKDWYELTGSKLKLNALDTVPLRPVSDYRNLLLQKWPAPEFTCVTKMQLSGMENGDVAGVVSLGTEYGALAVEKRDNKYTVRQILGTQYFDCDMPYTTQNSNDFELSESDFKDTGKTVTFRYTVKCTGHIDHMELNLPVKAAPVEELTLELSFDGKNYEKAFSFASKAGRWVGVKNGIFCAHDNTVKNDKTGYVLVDSVEYMPKED